MEATLSRSKYTQAQSDAEEYFRSPAQLTSLIAKAIERIESSGRFTKLRESVDTARRMIAAVARLDYLDVPWDTVALIIAAALYLVSPVALRPNAILGVGWLDDATLLGWMLKSIVDEPERFRDWEASCSLHITGRASY